MNTTYGVLNNSSLIIDTDKLRENVRTILRSLPAGTKLIPVVKDDAYGMGMVGVARTLSALLLKPPVPAVPNALQSESNSGSPPARYKMICTTVRPK